MIRFNFYKFVENFDRFFSQSSVHKFGTDNLVADVYYLYGYFFRI